MSQVIVIGSANRDLTVKVGHLPRVGETVSGGEFYSSFGGKGANQAVAARRAGADVTLVAKVGLDENGNAMVRHLEGLGLATHAILRDAASASGIAVIIVDSDGKNMIAVAPGSNWNLTEEEIARAEPAIASTHVLLIQLEVPLAGVRRALELARHHGVTTVLNPAPAKLLPPSILALVDILTPNEVEAAALTGLEVSNEHDAADAARMLLDAGIGQVVVTLGAKGSLWVTRDREQLFPAFHITSIDSTAAGDAFNGVLACALAHGRPMEEAIRFANAAGALTVARKGAQDALPTRDEIEQLIRSDRGIQ